MSTNSLLPPDEHGTSANSALRPVNDVHLSGDLGKAEQGVFSSLLESLRDVFFPQKLPPLVLESTPIPVVDRMAVKRDPTATLISTVINVSIMAVVLWYAAHKVVETIKARKEYNGGRASTFHPRRRLRPSCRPWVEAAARLVLRQ